MEQVLEQFVSRLVEEKGFPELEPEVLQQIKADLGERAENRIHAAILEHMPEGRLEEFEKKLDMGNAEEVQTFCRENVPDFDEVVAGALMDFRRVYLSA